MFGKGDWGVGRGVGRDLCGGAPVWCFDGGLAREQIMRSSSSGRLLLRTARSMFFGERPARGLSSLVLALWGRGVGESIPARGVLVFFLAGQASFFGGRNIHRTGGFFFIGRESTRRAAQAGVADDGFVILVFVIVQG